MFGALKRGRFRSLASLSYTCSECCWRTSTEKNTCGIVRFPCGSTAFLFVMYASGCLGFCVVGCVSFCQYQSSDWLRRLECTVLVKRFIIIMRKPCAGAQWFPWGASSVLDPQVYFHAELRPSLRSWISASRVRQVKRLAVKIVSDVLSGMLNVTQLNLM